MPLSDTKIRTAKPRERAYKLFDGGGLYLKVDPSGSKYWRLKYRLAGKEKTLALGVYPGIPLSDARAERDRWRKVLAQGQDPVTRRRSEKVIRSGQEGNTLKAVALEWMEAKSEDWSSTYAERLKASMEANLFPRVGSVAITEIDAPLLLAALRPIEARGSLVEAARVRRWCSQLFRYAIATGRASTDPAAHLRGAIKTRPVKSYPALSRKDLPDFQRKLAEYSGRPETRLALRLLLLTFVRPGELRAAKWGEIDNDAREWRIPAERMKRRVEHIVPLARQTIATLEELRELTGHSVYLLPGGAGRLPYISENTLNKAIASIGYKGRLVAHGFRATASTILNESGQFHSDVIERQLAHRDRSAIRAAYNRAEHLPERRKMMQWWTNLLDSLVAGGKVVRLSEASNSQR